MTVDVALDLGRHVARGEPLEEAARMTGIGVTTLWRWRAAGRAGDPRFSARVEAIDRARQDSGLARLVRRNQRDLGRRLSRN